MTTATDLTVKARRLCLKALADGQWQRVAEVQTQIPKKLAEARSEQTSAATYCDLGKVSFGRFTLAAEAIQALREEGRVETRGQGDKEEVRLVPAEGTVAAQPPRKASPQPAPAVDPPAEAANDTTPAADRAQPKSGPAAVAPEWPVVRLPVRDLRLHPVAETMPRMRPDEWEPFLHDVRDKGVQEPITVQQGNLILDGRHRFEAARQRGDEEILAHVVDLSEEEQVDAVFRSVSLRRHLSDDQRAMLAQEWAKAQAARSRQDRARKGGRAGGRSRKKAAQDAGEKAQPASTEPHGGAELPAQAPPPRTPRARERAAREFNVSQKKVAKAAALAAADPELAGEVRSGETTLAGARKELRTRSAEKKAAGAAPAGPKPRATFRHTGSEARLAMAWPPDLPDVARALYDGLGRERAAQLHHALGALVEREGQSLSSPSSPEVPGNGKVGEPASRS